MEMCQMNQINIQFCKTKIGDLILGSFEKKLRLLDFRYRKMRNTVDSRIKNGLNAEFVENDSETTSMYINGVRLE